MYIVPFSFSPSSPLPRTTLAEAVKEPRSGGHGKPPQARNPSGSGGEQCRIENLHDSMEFKLREVGTSWQLTLEEFKLCIGLSPIIHELMRRTTTTTSSSTFDHAAPTSKPYRKLGHLVGSVTYVRHNTKERDKEKEKKEREAWRLSSTTNDSLDDTGSCNVGRVRVRRYGKACKELTGLFMT